MPKLIIFVYFFIFFFCSSLPAYSQEGNLIIIVDASGSMWGRIQGTIKMELAKASLNAALNNIQGKPNIALFAFGHNRQRDCSDIEFLVPLKQIDKKVLSEKVNKLVPKGKTPLAETIRRAVSVIQDKGEKGTILIISDGKDTCKEDPCSIAKQLKENSRVDFTIDVIGMVSGTDGVPSAKNKEYGEESYAQLKCITEVTGGTFYSVKNAGEFSLAITEAIAKETRINKEQTIKDIEDYRFSTELNDGDYEVQDLLQKGKNSQDILSSLNVLSSGFIDTGVEQVGKIIQASTERKTIYLHEKIIVSLKKKAKPGDKFLFYEIAKEDIEDPVTGDEMGNLYEINGILEIIKHFKDNFYYAKVTNFFDIAYVGAPLMPYIEVETPKKRFYLKKPERTIKDARIIAAYQNHLFSGTGDIVYINKGRKDKLFIGDDFLIYPSEEGAAVKVNFDTIGEGIAKFFKRKEDVSGTKVKGVLTIIALRDRTAVAVITKSERRIITVSDKLSLIND